MSLKAEAVLSVPGKTFLLGEYLALEGGPSLVLSTSPRFVLKVFQRTSSETSASFQSSAFPRNSPADLYYQRHHLDLKEWDFQFDDPHHGQGGLGASSAQFALLYAFQNLGLFKNQSPFQADSSSKITRSLLEEYRLCAWNGEGQAPSGADVISQLHGGLTWLDGREHRVRPLAWPSDRLSFTLIRTGVKLATHEHLRQKKAAPHDALRLLVDKATRALETKDVKELVLAVSGYAEALAGAGLVAGHTQDLLRNLSRSRRLGSGSDLALAAKGCGAMGADVILVLHEPAKDSLVKDWARERSLEICGSSAELCEGLSGF